MLPVFESAREVRKIADHMEAGRERREAVRQVGLVVAAVIDQLIDRRIDIAVRNLIECADGEMPVGAKVMLYPHLADIRSEIHARERLPVALHRGIRSVQRQKDAF